MLIILLIQCPHRFVGQFRHLLILYYYNNKFYYYNYYYYYYYPGFGSTPTIITTTTTYYANHTSHPMSSPFHWPVCPPPLLRLLRLQLQPILVLLLLPLQIMLLILIIKCPHRFISQFRHLLTLLLLQQLLFLLLLLLLLLLLQVIVLLLLLLLLILITQIKLRIKCSHRFVGQFGHLLLARHHLSDRRLHHSLRNKKMSWYYCL